MPVSPGASGMQPRDPCRPWRGTLASGHKPRPLDYGGISARGMFSEGRPDTLFLHEEGVEVVAQPACRRPEPPGIDKIRAFFKDRNLPAGLSPCRDDPDCQGRLAGAAADGGKGQPWYRLHYGFAEPSLWGISIKLPPK